MRRCVRRLGCGVQARLDERPREIRVPINGTRLLPSGSAGVLLLCVRQCAII